MTITRTPGQHGIDAWARQMGNVSGFVFQDESEPTLYWAGDTILYEGVEKTLREVNPNVVVTHSGGAQFPGSGPIIMDEAQTVSICEEFPEITVVAVHLEALDHCPVTRKLLREAANQAGIPEDKLLIPEDGETISL